MLPGEEQKQLKEWVNHFPLIISFKYCMKRITFNKEGCNEHIFSTKINSYFMILSTWKFKLLHFKIYVELGWSYGDWC